MHLYTAAELREFLTPRFDVLEVAGSNVSTHERNAPFETMVQDADVWQQVVDIERALCREPGLVDSGSHLIVAAQRRAT